MHGQVQSKILYKMILMIVIYQFMTVIFVIGFMKKGKVMIV